MNLGISYMGTKKYISPYVCQLVENISGDGPFLDLFSGMCSVSSNIPDRPIWCNDAQIFASCVANLMYTTRHSNLSISGIENAILPFYEQNFNKLEKRFSMTIEKERSLLSENTVINELKEFYCNFPHIQNSKSLENERKRLKNKPKTTPWRLFSITYAGGYFGIQQSIEIDSIRFGIEKSFSNGVINKSQYVWLLVLLANTLSRCSTTTGHFAQYLKLNENNFNYYRRQRLRSIWLEWMVACNSMGESNNSRYRNDNKVFNEDANELLKKMCRHKRRPEIIYADPPYTTDQYSRYYHIYDTLLKYDYPSSNGAGRYPLNRFRSKFSLKTEVLNEIDRLVYGVQKLGSHFILSYPEDGIIENTQEVIYKTLKKSFNKVELAHLISHDHSTMGASKGNVKQVVNEMIFVARQK